MSSKLVECDKCKSQNVKALNSENKEIVNLLISNGFNPYKYDPINRKLINLKSYNKEQFNTIFIRDCKFVKNRIKYCEPIKIWNKKI